MIETIRAFFIIIVLLIFTLPLVPVQYVLNCFNLPARRSLPVLWHHVAARLIGLRLVTRGEMAKERPLLLVSNHISWLDIVALSMTGPVCFIAKKEVASWPAFSLLAKLQRTVFVNRQKRSKTGEKTEEIAARLATGDVMVLFAEGTSTSGTHVLPFRSSLLGAVQKVVRGDETMWVQPIAIAYTHLHGMPVITHERVLTGFYGDMDMAPHLMAVLKEGAMDVMVSFGQPIAVNEAGERKILTKQLEESVRTMKVAALRAQSGPIGSPLEGLKGGPGEAAPAETFGFSQTVVSANKPE